MPTDAIHFIVGMSRGGTTFMSKVLNTHPDVVSFGESGFFGRSWQEPAGPDDTLDAAQAAVWRKRLTDTRWVPRGDGPGSLEPLLGDDFAGLAEDAMRPVLDGGTPADVFDAVADAFRKAAGKPVAVEKTPHHLNYLDRILRHLPEARAVVMVRDAEGFVRSYKYQGQQLGPEARERFRRLYHPIPTALIWRGYYRQAERAAADHAEAAIVVGLDELKADEAGVLARVQRHLGLREVDLAGNVPPDNSSFVEAADAGGERLGLSEAERWWLHRLAGREIRRMPNPPAAPLFGLGVVWHALGLLPWLLRNAGHYRRSVRGSLFDHVRRFLR